MADPKTEFTQWLSDRLDESDMPTARRMIAKLMEDSPVPAQDADIQRRLRVSRQRMAEDAAVVTTNVLDRFPGMSRIRLG